eukprot:COSAG01_NODE_15739_length_1304_cov_25.850622_1_plen_207_part_10
MLVLTLMLSALALLTDAVVDHHLQQLQQLPLLQHHDVVQSAPEEPPFLYKGVDLSYVPQAESQGFQYFPRHGAEAADPVRIVADNGANIARLRIWHDPPYPNQTYANVSGVVQMARRVHAAGMLVHLDFMFSDWWAGPGAQWMPRVWSGCEGCTCEEGRGCQCNSGEGCRAHIDTDALAVLLYNFTFDVVSQVTDAIGEAPHCVQVG